MVIQDPAVVSAKNAHYGRFVTASKLIATLVSEQLFPSYFFQSTHDDNDDSRFVGLCLVASRSETKDYDLDPITLDDVYAVVPLCYIPELKKSSSIGKLNGIQYHQIEHLHPWDMLPHIYGPVIKDTAAVSNGPVVTNHVLDGSDTIHRQVTKIISRIVDYESHQDSLLSDECDAVDFWNHFMQMHDVHEKVATAITDDLGALTRYLTYQYDHPKPLPSLQSTSIEWEQSLIEGVHFYPISKYPSMIPHSMRFITPEHYSCLFENPKIRLVAIPRESMDIYGSFENKIAPVVKAILKESAKSLGEQYSNYFLMPVHHLQVTVIEQSVPDAIVLPEENHIVASGLSSLRTIAIPGVLDSATLKMSLNLRMGGAMRGIKLSQIRTATEFSLRVLPYLSYNREILTIQPEPAAAIYNNQNSDIAMQCSCIFRESVEYKTNPDSNEIFIVAAALTEKIRRTDINEPLIIQVWNLDTEEKRAQFLDRYIELYLQAFVPLCRDSGVAFDAHGQNVIARFDRSTGELKGFLIRDIDNAMIHPDTLRDACGVDFAPDSHSLATTKEHAYKAFYFSAIDCHLYCLIYILGMHHNRRGWKIAHTHLSKLLSPDHAMYGLYLGQKEVPSLSYIRSEMESITHMVDVFNPRINFLYFDKEEQVIQKH